MKILIVDDETSSLHLFLDQIIGNSRVECFFFRDDEEKILRFIKEDKIDGAFLDINMPSINGIDLAKKMIAIDSQIKIAFITGLTTKKETLEEEIQEHCLGIIYKPINLLTLENYLTLMGNMQNRLKVKMFGTFDCFLHDRLVRFSSAKSKELFALLLAMNGKSLTMEHAITLLWPNKDVDKAKILYRDAIWRLRSTLNEIGIPCVRFERAVSILDKRYIDCDYYDFLAGDYSLYQEEFLSSYDWSMPFETENYALFTKKK